MKNIIIILGSLLSIFKEITSLVNYNKTEISSCTQIQPNVPRDCYKNKFDTLLCCYFEMTAPDKGKVCTPMSLASDGRGGPVSTTLPRNITLTGNYDCNYVPPTTDSRLLKLGYSLFLIFILII
jgi:hypothetical protein